MRAGDSREEGLYLLLLLLIIISTHVCDRALPVACRSDQGDMLEAAGDGVERVDLPGLQGR